MRAFSFVGPKLLRVGSNCKCIGPAAQSNGTRLSKDMAGKDFRVREGLNTRAEGVKLHSPGSRSAAHPGVVSTMSATRSSRRA